MKRGLSYEVLFVSVPAMASSESGQEYKKLIVYAN
jgi:hypothetical protein